MNKIWRRTRALLTAALVTVLTACGSTTSAELLEPRKQATPRPTEAACTSMFPTLMPPTR